MALTLTPASGVTDGSSASLITTAPNNSAVTILPGPARITDRNGWRIIVSVAADQAFRLNYLFTPDNGTTWMVGKQVSSGTVTVDGGTAGYVKSAQLDVPLGAYFKVELYNASGSVLNGGFEYRMYCQGPT